MNDPFGIPETVLVLGATSEIATDMAIALADNGSRRFVLAARSIDALDDLEGRLTHKGAEVLASVPFDATDLDSHQAFIDGVWNEHGRIDLVLVAFGLLDRAVSDGTASATDIAMVNYVGAVSVIEPVAAKMTDQGGGVIAVLSSVAAERPRGSNYLYASAKAGLDAYARGLGDALQPKGVRVLVIRPGFVHTRMTEGLEPAPLSVHPPAVSDALMKGLAGDRPVVWAPPAVRPLMSVLRHLPTGVYRRVTKGR